MRYMRFYVSFISQKLYLWRVTNMLVLLPFIFKNNFLPSKICCSQNEKFNKTYLFQIYCMETKYQVSNQHCHYCYYWIFRKPGLQLNSVYQYLKLALVEIFFLWVWNGFYLATLFYRSLHSSLTWSTTIPWKTFLT